MVPRYTSFLFSESYQNYKSTGGKQELEFLALQNAHITVSPHVCKYSSFSLQTVLCNNIFSSFQAKACVCYQHQQVFWDLEVPEHCGVSCSRI